MDWRHAWVIGGGPSAASVDVDRLCGGVVVGVNDAAFHKSCQVFFSNDHRYAIRIRSQIEAFPGERHLSVRERNWPMFQGWPVTLWRRVTSEWPSQRRSEVSSGSIETPGCSGYVVLNFLAQMGVRAIVLFGYDFHQDYRYFFNNMPHNRRDIPGVMSSFHKVAPWYVRQGIKIWNASPGSAIKAFPILTHDEAYRLAA
jgi:hypothetical protein